MKIEIKYQEKMSLHDFAEKYDLTMQITERSQLDLLPELDDNKRYYSHFKKCEVKDGSFLVSNYGNGASPDESMNNYARNISGRLLVIDAYDEKRKEIQAPIIFVDVKL